MVGDDDLERKLLVSALVTLVLCIMLSGCSEPTASESQLKDDLENSPAFYSAQEMEISELTVTKRMTSKEDKLDTVYVDVTADNENIECHFSYVMTYALYNDGWLLEDVQQDPNGKWEIQSLKGVDLTQVQADADVPQSATCDEIYFYSEDGVYYSVAQFYWENPYTYMTETVAKVLRYRFSSDDGRWYLDSQNNQILSTGWKIIGSAWDMSKQYDTLQFSFTIDQISDSHISLTWFYHSENGVWTYDDGGDGEYFELKRVEQESWGPYSGLCYIAIIPDAGDRGDIGIYIFPDEGIACYFDLVSFGDFVMVQK